MGAIVRQADAEVMRLLGNDNPDWLNKLIAKRFKTDADVRYAKGENVCVEKLDMLNLNTAAELIANHLNDGHMCYFFSDFDADGMGCAAIAERSMGMMGFVKNQDYIIQLPNRMKENHGLNRNAVLLAKQHDAHIIITMDNGSSCLKEIALARELGMDVVVTDHHEVPAPDIDAIMVNPKNPEDTFGDENFCGAGITYIIMNRIAEKLGKKLDNNILMQIAATSTMADVVPLSVNNRSLVRQGVEAMRRNAIPFIRAVCDVQRVDVRGITPTDLGWKVAPLLNAVGRLGKPDDAYKALNCGDRYAKDIAQHLFNNNKKRQNMLAEMLQSNPDVHIQRDKVHLLCARDWHIGLVGLMAGRKNVETGTVVGCGCPGGDDEWRISFRSPGNGAAIGDALVNAAKDGVIIGGGGHDGAGGCTVKGGNLEQLADYLNEHLGIVYNETEIDGTVHPSWWTVDKIQAVEKALHPFGNGNPDITMYFKGVPDKVDIISDGKHLVMYFGETKVMAFGDGGLVSDIPGSEVGFVYSPSINKWRGSETVQAIVDKIISITPKMDMNVIS